jgi:CheY-like chemotaxis protein
MTMNVTPHATPSEAGLERQAVTGPAILVVDDDHVFGDAAARTLRTAGFEVSLAPDYRVALEVLESARTINLLITDIVMPEGVNGIALSRMARMRRPDLKVIYLTGYDIPGVEDEGIGAVLRKPIDDSCLLEEVRRVLATT